MSGLTCSKSRELLAYLLLHRDRPQRREAVADLLWGDDGLEDPRKALRQALWRLNSALDGEPGLLQSVEDDWIAFDSRVDLWLDVAVFEAACREIAALDERVDPEFAWRRAKQALELYRGELLDGSSWEWCHLERARLQDLYLALGDAALRWCLPTSDLTEGVRLGFEMLRHDPAREKTHRGLMRLHASAGDRSTALRQFQLCVTALQEDLGVEPGQRTRELAEEITEDRESWKEPPRSQSAPGVEEVLRGLTELRTILSAARHEVHLEIEALELALGRKDLGRTRL